MYSRQQRISKKPSDSTFAQSENRFAPRTDFAQTQPEQETQPVSPEEVEKIKASDSNWPDVSIFTTNRPAPAPRPRIQRKLNLPQQEKQPEEKKEDSTIIDDEEINLSSDQQTSTETSTLTSAPKIQSKLNIGEVGDKYEQEADQVADKVVNQINTPQSPPVQRKEQTKQKKSEQERLRREQQALAILRKVEKLKKADIDQYIAKMTPDQTSELLLNFSSVRASEAVKYKNLIHHIKTTRIITTGEGMVGTLKWRGGSGPDPSSGYQVSEKTSWGHQNDFAKWIRGNGLEPDASSTMNCWEGVLFIAYKAGVIAKSWLVEIHNAAAQAGNKVGGDPGVDAYNNVLKQRMNYNQRKPVPFDKKTGKRQGNIPAGSIIFINGLAHVVLAKGTKTSDGRHKVLSLWVLPAPGPTIDKLTGQVKWTRSEVGVLQDTTLEEVSDPAQPVEFAPAPW
jgi:hypothetical protein